MGLGHQPTRKLASPDLDLPFAGCPVVRPEPVGHHATSVVLHALNAALLFLLLLKMTGARWRSLAASGAVRPASAFASNPSPGFRRKDVLSTFFWLLTTWAWVRYAKLESPTSHATQNPKLKSPCRNQKQTPPCPLRCKI